jgi:3-hydroxymyristoyl/3-hydroxydecanoyl-(acyl carrier protein) dehydratase
MIFRLDEVPDNGDGRRFAVEIPAASPLFAGHFPGHPILPGVAQLALVERVLGPLSGVRNVKLRRQVAPGDRLDLRTGLREDGTARFDLSQDGEMVSNGTVLPSREAAGAEPVPAREGEDLAADLLPHTHPARLVRGVIEASEDAIVCAAEVPLDHPLVVDGRFPAFLGVEAAAQAAAVLEALARRDQEPGPRIGYLVGIRDARFASPALPAGRSFEVTARLQGGAFPLSIYEVTAAGAVTGVISTYISIRGG